MQMHSMRWSLLLLGILTAPLLWAQGVTARFDRSEIYQDETVTLIIESEVPGQGTEPELAPLQRNFAILGRNASTELRIINGQQSFKTTWRFELEPKRAGEIRIAGLTVGNLQTSPLTLSVRPRSGASQASRDDQIFLEIAVEPENPYVQAQVKLSVRLFYTVPLLSGELDEPVLDDAVLERLDDDIRYEANRNGQRYRVIERRYAFFPEKSGSLTIPALAFQGRMADASNSRYWPDNLLYRGHGRQVRRVSEPKTLQIRPRPASFSGPHWLPSAGLTLREEWPQQPVEFRVGEPVTRALIIEAQALSAAHLPELTIPDSPQFRVYPDQPVTNDRIQGTSIIGRREQHMAIVPTQPGELTLPAIRLPWWDTRTDEERVALLPARVVTVLPATNAAASPTPQPAPRPVPSPPATTPAPAAPPPALVTSPPKTVFWPVLSAAFLILWLLTLAGWRRSQRRDPAPTPASEPPPMAAEPARRALQQACRDNDATAAAKALLNWAAAVWPQRPPADLNALAARLATDPAPLQALDRALYAPEGGSWSGGAALWESVRKGLVEKAPDAARSDVELPSLYPPRADSFAK